MVDVAQKKNYYTPFPKIVLSNLGMLQVVWESRETTLWPNGLANVNVWCVLCEVFIILNANCYNKNLLACILYQEWVKMVYLKSMIDSGKWT